MNRRLIAPGASCGSTIGWEGQGLPDAELLGWAESSKEVPCLSKRRMVLALPPLTLYGSKIELACQEGVSWEQGELPLSVQSIDLGGKWTGCSTAWGKATS